MQKHQVFTPRTVGSGTHLPGAPARCLEHGVAQGTGNVDTAVLTSPIDDNDFSHLAPALQMAKKRWQHVGLIQHRYDDAQARGGCEDLFQFSSAPPQLLP